MPTEKLLPFHDPRIHLRSATLNGRTYGYIFHAASKAKRDTIILIHGFPDMSFGWRYQIPFLASLGLDVIALDCMGYGRTDSPDVLGDYTFKRIADDVATFCRQELSLSGTQQIILGGHDWGGAIVYRIAQYHADLIKALFSVCTPYPSPTPQYETLSSLVATKLPNFGYQIQFASGHVEEQLGNQSRNGIRAFLDLIYGGRPIPQAEGGQKLAFTAEDGVSDLSALQTAKLSLSKLLTEAELEYYVQEYARHGLRGPLNWYRTRELNFDDEAKFFSSSGKEKTAAVKQETLFILARKDMALKPFMADKMAQRIPRLTRKEVDAGHWALWEKPEEVNGFIGRWLQEKVWSGDGKSKL